MGDEAVNPVVGQLMRCYTCPAILSVLQNEKKPYRFEGIVIDSLWDVIVSLCKAGEITKLLGTILPYCSPGYHFNLTNDTVCNACI